MPDTDWYLHGGTVLDGLGGALEADVHLAGGRVAAIIPRAASPTGARPAAAGPSAARPAAPGPAPSVRAPSHPSAAHPLDCTGLLIAPGFIDAHTHDDTAATDPACYEAKIRQGVTTSVVAQDGFGWAPLPADPVGRDAFVRYWRPVNGRTQAPDGTGLLHDRLSGYLDALRGRLGLNAAALAGHVNLRVPHTGFDLRPVHPGELRAMAAALETALDDGACGLSTGLTYIPARASDTAELLALTPSLARRSLPYVSHMRGYGGDIFDAAEEALTLARQTGCAVHLSHLHISARAAWGRAAELIDRLDGAIASGLHVSWDLYPYQAGSSVLYQYFAPELQDGGPDAFLRRLRDGETPARLAADPAFMALDWSSYVISHTASGRFVGQSVAEMAAATRRLVAEAVVDLLIAEDLDVGVIVHQTQEADDDLFLLHPACAVGSDGIFASGRQHPRAYGAFARFWRRYVRDLRRLTPAEAVGRMAGSAARIHGLRGRGVLVPGAAADVAVFDGEAFADTATYAEPRLPAQGMRHVFVNGVAALLDGAFDPSARAGEALRPG